MKKICCWVLSCYTSLAMAQPVQYTVANAHSHNDYENTIPFLTAYYAGFGSIEADVYAYKDSLLVSHEKIQPNGVHRSFDSLYLRLLNQMVVAHNGHPYADTTRKLQLLIDIKNDSLVTISRVMAAISRYPNLVNNRQVHFVLTGARPPKTEYSKYPAFIHFDGNVGETYPDDAWPKIDMLSADFHRFSEWNGKSNILAPDIAKLKPLVEDAHKHGKPIRFWATPDVVNAWYQLMKLGIDYLNTDHIHDLAAFLNNLPANSYTNPAAPYTAYQPSFASDGAEKKAKNVILLIGDGTGLAQLYSGYTANGGQLNIFNIRNMGLSKTSSHDNYITDSAPGSTSIASGVKTNNRFVGVDHTGRALTLLPVYFNRLKKTTGLVTCGDVTDATPADFYAHRALRDSSAAIFNDLAAAPVQLLMGSGNKSFTPALAARLRNSAFNIDSVVAHVPDTTTGKWLIMERQAELSMLNHRGPWLQEAFDKTLNILKRNKAGFFMMTEGAQIDHGGHANNLPYVATEVMDFDQVVGRALQFADADGETLVIVTADHETGGLSLLGGDFGKGYVTGNFSTNDHTGIPVPVFAYGPGSQLFRGVYENTELFHKILDATGAAAR
ncbi:alkaline phosphatase [Deminuibacter soli]|nr:alkaline phosphatase [Deminuibacter soli]